MFGSLGFPELIMIFVVALVVFGPRRLPEIGRSIGKALGEFRRATTDLKSTLEQDVLSEDRQPTRDTVSSKPTASPEVAEATAASAPASSPAATDPDAR